MAQINRISSFKTFSEIKANEAAIKLAEENAAKRSEITSKISTILDEMEINSLEDLTEETRKELILKAFGEVSEEAEEENIPQVADNEEDEEVSEAVIVTGKRDAKKVLTAYKKFFERYSALADRRYNGLVLGVVKALMTSALTDANFHREAPVCAKAIKGARLQPIFIKSIELNKTELKVPVGKISSILDDNASIISGAAGYSGLGIAEGTALYLDSIGATKMAEDVLSAFNSTFESVAIMESKIEEGRAFVAARAKAIEEEAEEFEFNGKKYPVIKENSLVNEGTRGQFGKIDKKGNITSVYTHYDSYPENMLPIIKKAYRNGKDVDNVIDQGDMSGLDILAKINFYGGDFNPSKGTVSKIDKYLKNIADEGGAEYAYLWDEGSRKWMMADIYGDMELVPAFESVVTEAKFVKEFDKEVLDTNTKEEVLKIYPNAEFFVGKLTHFFGELDENLFFRAQYLGKKDGSFQIESVYSKKGSNYVHLYNEPVDESVVTEKTYNKKSLMKAMKADDGMIQLGNGEEYVIYAYGNGNDDNDDMWKDNSIFALDQDGEEHEIEYSDIVSYNEATVVMDAMDPKAKTLKKLLKKHNVTMKVLREVGDGGGWPEVELTGSVKDLTAVLSDKHGWDDSDLAEYIEESTVTEAEVKSDEEFKEYATTVLQKAFGEDYDEAKAKEVIDGILSKCGDDYGACVGTLTSSLS